MIVGNIFGQFDTFIDVGQQTVSLGGNISPERFPPFFDMALK